MPGLNTFLLVIAAIFPVVNPPGSALIFLGLTRGATPEIRRILARRVAMNSFIVLVCSLLLSRRSYFSMPRVPRLRGK